MKGLTVGTCVLMVLPSHNRTGSMRRLKRARVGLRVVKVIGGAIERVGVSLRQLHLQRAGCQRVKLPGVISRSGPAA